MDDTPLVFGSAFFGNNANGYCIRASAFQAASQITNCIIWAEAGTAVSHSGIASIRVRYSDVHGTLSSTIDGGQTLSLDPQFVDPINRDFRLLSTSPCIDAGLSIGTQVNLAGMPRFVDDPSTPDAGVGFPAAIDMGAYEFGAGFMASTSDLDADGDVDLQDHAIMTEAYTGPLGR